MTHGAAWKSSSDPCNLAFCCFFCITPMLTEGASASKLTLYHTHNTARTLPDPFIPWCLHLRRVTLAFTVLLHVPGSSLQGPSRRRISLNSQPNSTESSCPLIEASLSIGRAMPHPSQISIHVAGEAIPSWRERRHMGPDRASVICKVHAAPLAGLGRSPLVSDKNCCQNTR